jgi:hypothetical protein
MKFSKTEKFIERFSPHEKLFYYKRKMMVRLSPTKIKIYFKE